MVENRVGVKCILDIFSIMFSIFFIRDNSFLCFLFICFHIIDDFSFEILQILVILSRIETVKNASRIFWLFINAWLIQNKKYYLINDISRKCQYSTQRCVPNNNIYVCSLLINKLIKFIKIFNILLYNVVVVMHFKISCP